MSENTFINYFKNSFLPILSIIIIIFAVWYIFTVYLNSSIQIDSYERQKIDWDFSDLVRDTMSQKKTIITSPTSNSIRDVENYFYDKNHF